MYTSLNCPLNRGSLKILLATDSTTSPVGVNEYGLDLESGFLRTYTVLLSPLRYSRVFIN